MAVLSTHQPEALVTPAVCCHAEIRKSDLEVMARHLNEVEAVQHVHLTNIPLWFRLLGLDACKIDALDSGVCICCLASNGTNLFGTMMYGG